MKKGFVYSVVKEKCPRCNEGDLFKHKGLWSLKDIGATHERCSVCNQDFMMEDGFYLGATYVSYAFAVGIAVPILTILSIGFGVDFFIILGVILVVLLLLTPPIMRYSRSIWFNFFVHYDKDWKQENEKQKLQA